MCRASSGAGNGGPCERRVRPDRALGRGRYQTTAPPAAIGSVAAGGSAGVAGDDDAMLVGRFDVDDVDADSVFILRGCGPKGYPGMPEVANMPLPRKMLEMGVRDMVRVCDGRMSGTAYGTVVLHVAPEAAAGGLLAVIQDGDPIVLDAPRGLLQLDVTEEELIRRTPAPTVTRAFASPDRGWQRLYVEHVQQADTGADLDFLVGASGPGVARESH